MKKDIAEIWAQWLESGVIPQGRGQLCDSAGACCLGVLCELHRQMTGQGKWIGNLNRRSYATTEGDPMVGCLPPQVLEWAGMRTWDGRLSGASQSLAQLNDTGASFRKIAKIIRANASEL